MNIIIDAREQELIKHIQYFLENISKFKDIQMKTESLPIGDVIIKHNNQEKIYIERKSLNDLACSIKDGRYEEQSYRLNGLNIHNHNIVYLIEGDVNRINPLYKTTKNNIDKMTLYSAMFSLNYVKGFSVMRTFNTEESALYICQNAYKISKMREENKKAFYSQLTNELISPSNTECQANSENKNEDNGENKNEDEPQDEDKDETSLSTHNDASFNNKFTNFANSTNFVNASEDDYCNVVKKVKKENITPENIGEIILCQIPCVSSTSAIAIMKIHKTIPNLIKNIQENEDCLKTISYTNIKNQNRKINKSAISNIIKYLKK